MTRTLWTRTLLILLGLVLLQAPAAHGYKLRAVVSTGGASPSAGASGGGVVLRATLGQPLVGRATGVSFGSTSGYWPGGGAVTVSVESPGDRDDRPLPSAVEFGLPSPNPARGQVTFALGLPHDARVRLIVLDVQGRIVGETDEGRLAAGRYRLTWDGRGVAAGVYFARLSVDGRNVEMRRLALIR